MFRDSKSISQADWLRHRWAVDIGRRVMLGEVTHIVSVGGCELTHHRTAAAASRVAEQLSPVSLEEMIARYPEFAAGVALIEGYARPVEPGQSPRLARVPRRLWASYDVLLVSRQARYLCLISAKARAMFPRHHAVFVRVYPPVGKA
ncbi:hypothetical protein K9B35_14170 [Sphingomonas sp. R647]|uniref:hypothetical protein n=1 Tax=Sphingomonas sp. R647 TaxID=2875233 RepID=UPI001CD4ABA2|nr:hypothetical protein [Sphingomonas sp. R647]MCA1199119.1 hypothetical protein [Sphingomonas sp. R647]